MLNTQQKLAIYFYDQLGEIDGKMGHGVLRYSPNPVCCIIDYRYAGGRSRDVLDFGADCPIVGTVDESAALGAEVLVLGMAPSGGRLPDELLKEVDIAVERGLCVVNGLHSLLGSRYPNLSQHQWIWDIRVEPEDLPIASGRAQTLNNRRVLMVGSDMAVGKMTAGLEINMLAQQKGIRSAFLATGQIGITVSGSGIPLDAIRVDYACGALEKMVMDHADQELLIIEGQGSLIHPGSTSNLPLLRGTNPTHLIMCHRAGISRLQMDEEFRIPPLTDLIQFYEDVSSACGTYKRAKTVGIALDTRSMGEEQALREIETTQQQTGLPTTDVMRFGCECLLDALMGERR
jgi:uncharacterized NAD-dependent epimerase/dehydratase family protein